MRFTFKNLQIPGLVLIEPHAFEDERGFFMETYHRKDFEKAGIPQVFVQDNHSRSKKNVLRGLHYQIEPMAQGKLVRCVRGTILDIAVDIRKQSPTFGKWVGTNLSGENKLVLWVPRGFAHGYLALEGNTEVLYKTDEFYSPEHERGIIWSDPDIAIKWPVETPIVSKKDAKFPTLKHADAF